MTNRTSKSLLALSLLATVAVTAGCADDDDSTPVGTASLRVVHGSPDAPAVDVYAKGSSTPLLRAVAYGAATDYITVPAGDYVIELRAAGTPASSAAAHTTGTLSLAADARVTAIAVGLLGSTDPASQLRVLPMLEQWGPDAAGKVRVRIVHASADAPTVAIDVGNDGSAEVPALARFADTGAAGIELPAAQALQVGIWAGSPLARVTAFTTPALPDGAELFVIATGRLAAKPRVTDGFALLAVAPTAAVGFIKQNPVVYALHASPDAPAVDIFAGAGELTDNLAFAQLGGAIQVPPGSYTLDLFAHAAGATRPAGAPAFSYPTPALAAGERYLAVATGFLSPAAGEQGFRIEAFAERFGSDPGALVRVIHASPDAPTVDIGGVVAGTYAAVSALSGLAFPAASADAGVALPAGPLTIGVAPAGSTTTVARFGLTMPAGRGLFAAAVGALSPASDEQSFRLVVIDTSAAPWSATAVSPQ